MQGAVPWPSTQPSFFSPGLGIKHCLRNRIVYLYPAYLSWPVLNLDSAVCYALGTSAPFMVFRRQSGVWGLFHCRAASLVLEPSCAAVLSAAPWQMCFCLHEREMFSVCMCAHLNVFICYCTSHVCDRQLHHCAFPQVVCDSNASKILPVVASNGF